MNMNTTDGKADRMADEYGKIVSVTIDSYYKYVFDLTVMTDKGRKVHLRVGGDPDDIYRFDPSGIDWEEAVSHVYFHCTPHGEE